MKEDCPNIQLILEQENLRQRFPAIHSTHDKDLPALRESLKMWKKAHLEEVYPQQTECAQGSHFQVTHQSCNDRNYSIELIRNGRFGVILLAGGQGSRMGLSGPKGYIEVSPIRQATLFQLLCEKICAAQQAFGGIIPLAVMCSKKHLQEIETFFETHSYWGLNRHNVDFFAQEDLPLLWEKDAFSCALDPDGSLLLGPDGNGGAFHYFHQCTLMKKWLDKGVEYVSTVLIDNPLMDPVDIHAIARIAQGNYSALGVAISRQSPTEKVGVFVVKAPVDKIRKKEEAMLAICEYSELDPGMRSSFANTGCFVWHLPSIWKGISIYPLEKMPLHWAKKEYEAYGIGKTCFYKAERFIFDWLYFLQEMGRTVAFTPVDREKYFHPVKNSSGDYSVQTAAKALIHKDQEQLRDLGLPVVENSPLEIDALYYYLDPREISHKKKQNSQWGLFSSGKIR